MFYTNKCKCWVINKFASVVIILVVVLLLVEVIVGVVVDVIMHHTFAKLLSVY